MNIEGKLAGLADALAHVVEVGCRRALLNASVNVCEISSCEEANQARAEFHVRLRISECEEFLKVPNHVVHVAKSKFELN